MKPAAVIVAAVLVVASAAFAFQVRPPADDLPAVSPAASATGGVPSGMAAADAGSYAEWRRPEGPVRIALQAGHWRSAEAPDEQAGLRSNGTRGGGRAEWEVNLEIAKRTAAILEDSGYVVDILPTTIPPGYWADLFISIHADGNPSPAVSGFRSASPRRDATGRAATFAKLLDSTYGGVTGLAYYPTVTRRMRGYYAFNHRRYQHALHPMTVGVILETGFLTSPRDRSVIVGAQDLAARGIAQAVALFLDPVPPELEPNVAPAVTHRQPEITVEHGHKAR